MLKILEAAQSEDLVKFLDSKNIDVVIKHHIFNFKYTIELCSKLDGIRVFVLTEPPSLLKYKYFYSPQQALLALAEALRGNEVAMLSKTDRLPDYIVIPDPVNVSIT